MEVDSDKRKDIPIFSGAIRYFPDALAEVAALSRAGNEKHSPGQPMHWARSKSGDELDALTRHLAEAGTVDTDGFYHDVKVAWRALANLQKLLERVRGLPISPGSRAAAAEDLAATSMLAERQDTDRALDLFWAAVRRQTPAEWPVGDYARPTAPPLGESFTDLTAALRAREAKFSSEE